MKIPVQWRIWLSGIFGFIIIPAIVLIRTNNEKLTLIVFVVGLLSSAVYSIWMIIRGFKRGDKDVFEETFEFEKDE